MGKPLRWFRSVLCRKKPDHPISLPHLQQQHSTTTKERRRWSSAPVRDHHGGAYAASTARVPQGAPNGSSSASVVARESDRGRSVTGSLGRREDFAALNIQSVYRGHLARRARRALRAVVRVQAILRGQIQRKRLNQQLQAVLMSQLRARRARIRSLQLQQASNDDSSQIPNPTTTDDDDNIVSPHNHSSAKGPGTQSRSWNHHKRITSPYPSCCDESFSEAKDTSPSVTRLRAFADQPNYMSYTESARAKTRSALQSDHTKQLGRFEEPRWSTSSSSSTVRARWSRIEEPRWSTSTSSSTTGTASAAVRARKVYRAAGSGRPVGPAWIAGRAAADQLDRC